MPPTFGGEIVAKQIAKQMHISLQCSVSGSQKFMVVRCQFNDSKSPPAPFNLTKKDWIRSEDFSFTHLRCIKIMN